MNLQEIELLPSFALLGPGWAGAGQQWTLRTGLCPSACDAGLALLAFEQRADDAVFWEASACVEVQPSFSMAEERLEVRLERDGYDADVDAIRAAIAAGDVYQVCLTRAVSFGPQSGHALLARLCARGTPPFAAWVRLPDGREIVSGSPELFFRIEDGLVHTMPMKGTAPPNEEAALDASEKDAAELAMITDLLRNDLRSVCIPKSILVQDARMKLRLPYAVQTVSHVTGVLNAGVAARGVLAALHPGGSITGAPKAAALELISELEATPRGAYTGALCDVQPTRTVCSLLIRTAVRLPEGWSYGVGGGITIDSAPEQEWSEMHTKLSALVGAAR